MIIEILATQNRNHEVADYFLKRSLSLSVTIDCHDCKQRSNIKNQGMINVQFRF